MKKTIRDIDLDNKRVLVRCDFNVPLDKDFNITDNRRVVSAIPTIQYLIEHNCKVILCSNYKYNSYYCNSSCRNIYNKFKRIC